MPIIGLTDNISPRFPLLGRLATLETGGFVFEPTHGHEFLWPIFTQAYGELPKHLDVWLAFNTLEATFPNWLDQYADNSRALVRRCDGRNLHLSRDDQGNMKRERLPCLRPKKQCKCTHQGYLNLILPKIMGANVVGMVQLQTGNVPDIIAIAANLKAVLAYQEDFSHTTFTLAHCPQIVANQERYVCSLFPGPDWLKIHKPFPEQQHEIELKMPIPEVFDECLGRIGQLQRYMGLAKVNNAGLDPIVNRIAGHTKVGKLTDTEYFRLRLELMAIFAVNSKKFLSFQAAIAGLKSLFDDGIDVEQLEDDAIHDLCQSYLKELESVTSDQR